jgi:hypothetical protein
MSETAAIPSLAFSDHFARLCQISIFTKSTLFFIDRHDSEHDSEVAVAKATSDPEQQRAWLQKVVEDAPNEFFPHLYFTVSQARNRRWSFESGSLHKTLFSEPSRQLVCNLSLVMLCTQMEVFMEHLIDVILHSCPLRIKDLASEKKFTAAELVDFRNYEEVMHAVRRKVSKEVTEDSTRRMFEHHLGSRFGLFRKEELFCRKPLSDKIGPNWGMTEIESAFNMRHKIVHEGDLSCTPDYFDSVWHGFLWLVTFLSQKARAKYHLPVSVEDEFDMWANTYRVDDGRHGQ